MVVSLRSLNDALNDAVMIQCNVQLSYHSAALPYKVQRWTTMMVARLADGVRNAEVNVDCSNDLT